MINTQSLSNPEQPFGGWALDLNARQKFLLVLLASAISGWYVPQLIMMLITGMWLGGLTMMLANLVAITGLMGINLIGNKLNRVLLFGFIVAIGITFYEVSFISKAIPWSAWQSWMPQLIAPSTVVMLNAYLFEKHKSLTGFLR